MSNLLGIFVLGHYGALYTQNDGKWRHSLMNNLITERTPALGGVGTREWYVPAFSRSVGYLGHAWCRSDSQILARNGIFLVTVACKSKTTQSELSFLDEASAVCQARTPRRRRMQIRSESSLRRLWDFERPRPQIPIPRHRKDFVVMCCCVYREPGRGARALHVACWLLGALEEAVRTRAHAVRGAFYPRGEMARTARGETAWITRGEMARTARGETATAAATGNSRAAAAPGVRLRLRARWVQFPGGRKFSWYFSGWAERPWRYLSW